MGRKRYYFYEFSDGSKELLTPGEAKLHADTKGLRITKDGYESNKRSVRRTADGFQPGFQHQLGKYIGGKREYERELNRQGFVEVGNEKVQATERKTKYFTDEVLRDIKKEADVSDSTLDSLKESEA